MPAQPYAWINLEELPALDGAEDLVLFGGGQGSHELLAHLRRLGFADRVKAVADNDPSYQGKRFEGLPIVGPQALADYPGARILITSVSGRDAIAEQLEALGYREGADFFKVGSFPRQGAVRFGTLLQQDAVRQALPDMHRAGHVGPGGFLDLECGLHALGVEAVYSADAFTFGLGRAALKGQEGRYAASREAFAAKAAARGLDAAAFRTRWDALFREEREATGRDAAGVHYDCPARFSALPWPDDALDLLCSFAVLEHVEQPEAAVASCARVLRPGGLAVHRIQARDHRSFRQGAGYTPISYYAESEEGWRGNVANRFHQNRTATWQWRKLFEAAGFAVLEHQCLERYEPDEAERAALHPDFRHWPLERLAEVDCLLVLRKGG